MRCVTKFGVALVALATGALVPTQASGAPLTQYELHSQPGDWVGGGQSYFGDLSTGVFDISQASDLNQDGFADFIFLRYLGNELGTFANIYFGTSLLPGTNFAPGFYDDAERAPALGAGHAGLDWAMNGRGCNKITGNFTVLGAQFDYSGGSPSLVSFGVTFEQQCEGLSPALFGTLYYNFDPGRTAPIPEPSTLSLLGVGCGGLLARARLRQSARRESSARPGRTGSRTTTVV